MFVILQKYDFSSKSQRIYGNLSHFTDVCDTAKVRFFKQITTYMVCVLATRTMFVILQKYDFSSKSQLVKSLVSSETRCLWYCKSTIFQANHNKMERANYGTFDVCDTAKVRFFKQITTALWYHPCTTRMFVILQKYDFSSKSQLSDAAKRWAKRCLWYCKSTIFQANHNRKSGRPTRLRDVCDTAKVRFFKQITTLRP